MLENQKAAVPAAAPGSPKAANQTQADCITTSPGPQLLSHSRESEESLLGSVLINPDALIEVLPLLQADDFYIHRHRWVWEALLRLNEGSRPIDLLTVANELQAHNKLEDVGGMAYLTGLINVVPSSFHAVQYARTVAELGVRRLLLETANLIAKGAYDTTKPLSDIGATAADSLSAALVQKSLRLKNGPQLAHQIMDAHEQAVVDRATGKPAGGIQTGIAALDEILQGITGGNLALIAARPGNGKSSLLMQVADYVYKHRAEPENKAVVFFSLEMSAAEQTHRLLAQQTGIPAKAQAMARIPDHEMPVFINALSEVAERQNWWVDDTPGITAAYLDATILVVSRKCAGVALVVVDYIQLMGSNMTDRFVNRNEQIGQISRRLKELAKKYDVPFLVAAQLNRATESRADKRPQLSDLRESGSLELDADIVIFVSRPPDKDFSLVDIAKHRNGALGEIQMIFDGERTLFIAGKTTTFKF